MKLFLCSIVLCFGVSMPVNAACPEGHISCEEASRLNGAASTMSTMTGTSTSTILTCDETTTS